MEVVRSTRRASTIKNFCAPWIFKPAKKIWEYPQIGSGVTWGGLLATASGLIFFCDDAGAFAAVDATDGKPLWHFNLSQSWHASPLIYAVDGKQFVAVAAGSNIVAFAVH